MQIRKILGSMIIAGRKHAIAKLANGCYAVGTIVYGKKIPESEHVADFDTAFDLWLKKANFPPFKNHRFPTKSV